MTPPAVNRYSFYKIFQFTPALEYITPLFNVRINGVFFQRNTPIPKGTAFGGLNLYSYMGKDIAGIWNDSTKELTIIGFY